MLKSTYRQSGPAPAEAESPLPPGWTEHKAPTGHTYYYNTDTQQSTYTRPSVPTDEPLQIDYGATEPDHVMRASLVAMEQFRQNNSPTSQPGHFTGGQSYQDRSKRRGNQGDRPKSKAPIPNCAPWVLVKTKLGRRFVHNTETKQSLWKFPQEVMMKVIDMDRIEWEEKKRKEEEAEAQKEEKKLEPQAEDAVEKAEASAQARPERTGPEDYDSDSYEEVEVTDDEAEEEDGEPSKRPRLSHDEDPAPSGPVEFDEEDIAWQLAQMEGEGDYAEYGDPDDQNPDNQDRAQEEEEEGLPLTETDNIALFRSLLDDSGISPYSTFEKFIEDTRVVEDPRYVALPNTSSRNEAFSQWSKDRIAEIQQLKAQEAARSDRKSDPKVEYLQFLQKHATPKLYWPEFKRKFKRSPEMADRNLQDKDREKIYRELVVKLKLGEGERRKELVGLLKDTARKDKNSLRRGMGVEELPDGILRDVRFYILEEGRRDELVRTFLETL